MLYYCVVSCLLQVVVVFPYARTERYVFTFMRLKQCELILTFTKGTWCD